MKEEWREIDGHNGYYVSNLGNVKSAARKIKTKDGITRTIKEKILKQATNNCGYKYVSLNGNDFYFVANLVYNAFYGNLNGLEIDHIDGDRGNNSVDNLRAVTHQQNCMHKKLVRKPKIKMTDDGCYEFNMMFSGVTTNYVFADYNAAFITREVLTDYRNKLYQKL